VTTRVKFELVGDTEARQKLTSLSRSFYDESIKIQASLSLVSRGLEIITGGIGKTIATAMDWVRSANEAERIERRLASALALRGANTDTALDRLKQFNGEIQRSLGISGDHLANLEAQLLSMGVLPSKIEEATKATIGLGGTTGNLDSAARAVARAYAGNTSALRSYGIEAKTVTEAQAKLQELFAVAEAQAGTFEQRVNTLRETWDGLGESLGAAITQSGVAKGGIEVVSDAVSTLILALESSDAKAAINGFFGTILFGAGQSINALLGLTKSVRDLFASTESSTETIRARVAFLETRIIKKGEPFGPFKEVIQRESAGEQLEIDQLRAELTRRALGVSGPNDGGLISALQTFADRLIQVSGEGGLPTPPPSSPRRGRGVGEGGGAGGAAREKLGAAADLERLKLDRERVEDANEHRISAHKAMLEVIEGEERDHYKRLGAVAEIGYGVIGEVGQAVFGGIAQAISGALQGEDFGAIFTRAVGNALVSWGTMLIQAGIVGAAIGVFSTAFPYLGAALFGVTPGTGPILIGLSAGAIAIGAGLVGLGGSMGGSGSGGGSRASLGGGGGGGRSSGGGTPGSFDTRAPDRGRAQKEPTKTEIHINLGRGFVTGSPRRVAREIAEVLKLGGYRTIVSGGG
jgi:hypothetical protein